MIPRQASGAGIGWVVRKSQLWVACSIAVAQASAADFSMVTTCTRRADERSQVQRVTAAVSVAALQQVARFRAGSAWSASQSRSAIGSVVPPSGESSA